MPDLDLIKQVEQGVRDRRIAMAQGTVIRHSRKARYQDAFAASSGAGVSELTDFAEPSAYGPGPAHLRARQLPTSCRCESERRTPIRL